MSGGGGAMADAFIDLGDKLQNNFSRNQESAWQNRQARNRLDEEKRQFDLMSLLKKAQMNMDSDQFGRSSGMSAIQMLAGQRQNAMNNFMNQKLKDSFYRG